MHKYVKILLVTSFMWILIGCQKGPNQPEMEPSQNEKEESITTSTEETNKLTISLMNDEEVNVGEAIIKEKDNGVEITIHASHLEPGSHGFHIHEKGICEPPGFETSGGHFNPNDLTHGFESEYGPHYGDIDNLKVEEDGTVQQTFFNEYVTLKKGEENSLLNKNGTSLIIHDEEDDYRTEPAGNAGKRIVCGVISENESNETTMLEK